DLDAIAVTHLANRTTCQCLRPDVADTGAGRNTREAGVGQDRDLLAEAQMLERRGDLVNLFHTRPHRTTADQNQDVPRLQSPLPVALDRPDGRAFAREDAGRTYLAKHAISIHNARIDSCALDYRPFRSQVAARKRDR